MPYVERNEAGKIVGVFANTQPGYAEEWVDGDDVTPEKTPEIELAEKRAELEASDKDMARVAEDVIGALILKGLLSEDDLPPAVKTKLQHRAALRDELRALETE